MSPRTFIRRPADWSWEEQSSVVDEEFAGIRVVHPGGHLVKALDRMVTALDVGIVGVEHVRLTNLVALDEIKVSGIYRVVTPDECVALAREAGTLVFHPLMGGMPPELGWESLELFASKVLPRL